MATPLETLKRIAPAFAPLGDAALNEWLADSLPSLDPLVFGDSYTVALAYYTAACIATSGAPGGLQQFGPAASPIIGERAGEVARNYSQVMLPSGGADNWLRLSAYGLKYLEIRAQRAGTKPLTTADLNWRG
jgi:hypothetical protein